MKRKGPEGNQLSAFREPGIHAPTSELVLEASAAGDAEEGASLLAPPIEPAFEDDAENSVHTTWLMYMYEYVVLMCKN